MFEGCREVGDKIEGGFLTTLECIEKSHLSLYPMVQRGTLQPQLTVFGPDRISSHYPPYAIFLSFRPLFQVYHTSSPFQGQDGLHPNH
jgi:hypothetical protein